MVKIGSSSVTTGSGRVDTAAIDKLAGEVAEARAAGLRVVVVTSGAIAAGWTSLAPDQPRPTDLATLQAVAAVGQHRLMQVWSDALEQRGLMAGQVLLAPLDFVHRSQYLHARQTLGRLLDLGVVPVVNENDAVADEEIRFGDNDRLAALVAHLVRADLLVLLTDTAGLLTEDPRRTGGRVAHRGGGRDRPRARAHRRRPGHRGGQRRHGLEAGRGQDRGVVGGGGGHRRRRPPGGPGRGDRVGSRGGDPVSSPRAPPAGPQAVDRLRHRLVGHHRGRRRRPPGPGRPGPVAAPGRRGLGPGRVRVPTTPWRSPARTVPSSPRAWSARTRPRSTSWAGRRSDELPEDVAPEVVHRDDLVVLD